MPSIEKHSFKITIGVAITAILVLLGMTAQFTRWQTAMEAEHSAMEVRQDHLSAGHAANRGYIDGIEIRQDGAEITLTRVETKLISIESLLIQMRNDMRD